MRIDKAVLAVIVLLPTAALAAGGVPLEHAGTDIRNEASLQRGARNFVNYCLGCHSAQYLRWNRMAADLEIGEQDLEESLMFTGGKPYDPMISAMPRRDAVAWFGVAPPDLSLIARSRGVDYVYTFLKSYYADPGRPTGVNNLVLPNTAMPHVLAHLQGLQRPRIESVTEGGVTEEHVAGLGPGAAGELTPEQYEDFLRDTVNFLDYMGEPVKAQRQKTGVWVVLFLLVFWLLAWLLKKEYWKDIR